MFARLSSGELSVFSRRMIMLRVRIEDPVTARALFYGTRRSGDNIATPSFTASNGCCAARRVAIRKA